MLYLLPLVPAREGREEPRPRGCRRCAFQQGVVPERSGGQRMGSESSASCDGEIKDLEEHSLKRPTQDHRVDTASASQQRHTGPTPPIPQPPRCAWLLTPPCRRGWHEAGCHRFLLAAAHQAWRRQAPEYRAALGICGASSSVHHGGSPLV